MNRSKVTGSSSLSRLLRFGLLGALVATLASFANLVNVEKLVAASKDVLSSQEALLESKTELIGTLDDRLRTLREEDLETLLTAIARARSAVSKEEREKDLDCKFEIEALESEWNGKVQLALQEVDFEKDELLEELELQAETERRRREERNEPFKERQRKLALEIEALREKRVQVEVSRIAGKFLEKTSDEYLEAFFHRMQRGNFAKAKGSLFQQTQDNARANGLWRLDSRGQVANLTGDSLTSYELENFLQILPKEDSFGNPHYPRGGYWMKCALVGSSGLLMRYGQGDEIDAHDAVFRFDDAPTETFERHVGSKTTIRIVSDAGHLKTKKYWSRKHQRELILQHISDVATLRSFVDFKSRNPQGTKNLRAMAPNFQAFINRFVSGPSLPRGFYGVALALQKCSRVTVYGFSSVSPSQMRKFGLKGRYFDVGKESAEAGSFEGYGEEVTTVLLSELSRHFPVVRVAEPCLSFRESHGGCKKCSLTLPPRGSECRPSVPFPVPSKGYCQESEKRDGFPICFSKCFANETCPGGFEAPPCTEGKRKRAAPCKSGSEA